MVWGLGWLAGMIWGLGLVSWVKDADSFSPQMVHLGNRTG